MWVLHLPTWWWLLILLVTFAGLSEARSAVLRHLRGEIPGNNRIEALNRSKQFQLTQTWRLHLQAHWKSFQRLSYIALIYTLSQALRKEEDQEAFYVLSVRPGSGSYGCAGVVFRMGLLRRNQPQAIFSVIIGLIIKFISWSGHDGLLKVQLQGQGAGGAHPWWWSLIKIRFQGLFWVVWRLESDNPEPTEHLIPLCLGNAVHEGFS